MANGVNLCPNPSGEAGLAYLGNGAFWTIASDLEGGGQRYVASAAAVPNPTGDSFCEFGVLTMPALTAPVNLVYSWEGRSIGLSSGSAVVYAQCHKSDGTNAFAPAVFPDLDTGGGRSLAPIAFAAPIGTVLIVLGVKLSSPASGSTFSLKNIQLELGSTATDFSQPVTLGADLVFDDPPPPPPSLPGPAAPRSTRQRWGDTLNVRDFYHTGDTDWTAAFLRCRDILADRSLLSERRGGTIFVPDGDYLLSETILIETDLVAIAGQSAPGTRLLRTTDYGYTIHHRGTNGLIQGPGLRYLQFVDANGSMTVENSPHHVCQNYTVEARLIDLVFNQGAGAVALLGAQDTRGGTWKFVTSLGDPSGRSGVLIGPTTVSDPFQLHGGDIILSDINIQADLGTDTPRLDDGFRVTCVDGLWISQAHSISAAEADFRIRLTSNLQMSNIFLSDVLLDITAKDGLVIDVDPTLGSTSTLDAMQAKLDVSCSDVGGAYRFAVYKSAPSNNVKIEAEVAGWRGSPVVWRGGSVDDTLDLSVTSTATDRSDGFAITIQDPIRTTLRLKSVGAEIGSGDQKLLGGIHVEADTSAAYPGSIRSLTVLGGRIGDLQIGAPAVQIDPGYGLNGGAFHMVGTDCSTTAGMVNASTTAIVDTVGCPGISPNAPLQKSHLDTSSGSASWLAYTVTLPASDSAVLLELALAGVVGGVAVGTVLAAYSITNDGSVTSATQLSYARSSTLPGFFDVTPTTASGLTIGFDVQYTSASPFESSFSIRATVMGQAFIV